MKALKRHTLEDKSGGFLKKIRNSNIGHRFEDKMYFKFMEYINASADGELFNMVYNDKILDVILAGELAVPCIHNPL